MRFWLFDDGLASSAPGFWCVARVRELDIEAPFASTRARTALGGSLIGLVWQIFFGLRRVVRVRLDTLSRGAGGLCFLFKSITGQVANNVVEIPCYDAYSFGTLFPSRVADISAKPST